MGRPPRLLRPGLYYHVCNRAQSHAPLIETVLDCGRFDSLLGRETSLGTIQVLCRAFMNTHYHLLLRCFEGNLDEVMQRIQLLFAMYYNRTRDRVGHVFKSRYFARPVYGDIDIALTADYIDWNPVAAGMVEAPGQYAHGSARYYCGEAGLTWLSRDRLESIICRLTGKPRFSPSDYPRLWTFAQRAGSRAMIARAVAQTQRVVAPIAVLAAAGPDYVQKWLRECLELEEGRSQPCLVLPGEVVLSRLAAAPSDRETTTMRAGLLSMVSGWTTGEIARSLGVSQASASRLVSAHREHLRADAAYMQRVSECVASATADLYGALAG